MTNPEEVSPITENFHKCCLTSRQASSSSNDLERSTVIDMEDVAEHHENQSRRGSISFDEFMTE